MIEEPYRWLEAIGNRREYVREQIKGGSPVFAAALPEGILLLGVGGGNSKVFEIFDRHALAGLGHPADIEKIRQAAIDAAHTEAFTRAPEDVSLRRLVSYGLGPQLKTNFEQIFSAPFLVELLFAEVGLTSEQDVLLRLHFDGSFQFQSGGVMIAAGQPEIEAAAQNWLAPLVKEQIKAGPVVDLLLQTWWCLTENKPVGQEALPETERRAGWEQAVQGKIVEIGWLKRHGGAAARYQALTLKKLGL